jgi:hypothetical protein
MNNSNDGSAFFFAGLILFALSPLIFITGFAAGQAKEREQNTVVMSQVLAKGCIKSPQNCKTYQEFYTAVENFKDE